MATAQLDVNSLLGAPSDQFQTVNDQASANSLNAQGWQLAPGGYTQIGTEGQGQWLMKRKGINQGDVVKNLLSQYVNSYNEGKAANESRYADILKGFSQREADANSLLAGMGDTAKLNLNRQYDQAGSSAAQSAIGRGLTNSSAALNMQRGIEADRARSLMAIDEGLRKQALDYRTSLSGDRLNFMAQRNDQYPGLDQIGQLAQYLSGNNTSPTASPGTSATAGTGTGTFSRTGSG
jgi:hypothetical protein